MKRKKEKKKSMKISKGSKVNGISCFSSKCIHILRPLKASNGLCIIVIMSEKENEC